MNMTASGYLKPLSSNSAKTLPNDVCNGTIFDPTNTWDDVALYIRNKTRQQKELTAELDTMIGKN